jgi:hypothetical protein
LIKPVHSTVEGYPLRQVAALIHSLQLERNGATLLLSNLLDEEEGDDDALTRPATKVQQQPASRSVRLSSSSVRPSSLGCQAVEVP